MLPDRVSNPGPLTYESGALPIALRGPAPNYLNSCLAAITNHVIKYCKKVYEMSGKNLFWSIKNSHEIINKLKSRGFRASSLSTYDFSTLYTTLPHNLIKDKLVE